jgi:hypothetical protein
MINEWELYLRYQWPLQYVEKGRQGSWQVMVTTFVIVPLIVNRRRRCKQRKFVNLIFLSTSN